MELLLEIDDLRHLRRAKVCFFYYTTAPEDFQVAADASKPFCSLKSARRDNML